MIVRAAGGHAIRGPSRNLRQRTDGMTIESSRPPLVVDARGEIEFKRGHIKGALNVPVRKLLLHTAWLPTDKGREVVVTCEHGQRAAIAKALLSLYGFHNTEFLEGSLEGWKEAGLPLETGDFHLAHRRQPEPPQAAPDDRPTVKSIA
jgi:rhodanese-related sulfurtransferase